MSDEDDDVSQSIGLLHSILGGAPSEALLASPLDPRDVPELIRDFANILLRTERKCILCQAGDQNLQQNAAVQTDARICASLNARLQIFFKSGQHKEHTNSPVAFESNSEGNSKVQHPSDDIVVGDVGGNGNSPSMQPVVLENSSVNEERVMESEAVVKSSEEPVPTASPRPSPRQLPPLLHDKLQHDFSRMSEKFHKLCDAYNIIPSKACAKTQLQPSSSSATSSTTAEKCSNSQISAVDSLPRLRLTVVGENSVKRDVAASRGANSRSPPRMLHIWDNALDVELRRQQLQEMRELESCMENLKELQQHMSSEVVAAEDALDTAERELQETEWQSRQAARELVKAAKAKSRWWGLKGSGAGLLAGGLAGIALGPIGIVAGASIGGIVGLVTGSALTKRHRRSMDSVALGLQQQQLPQPRRPDETNPSTRRSTENG